MRRLTLEQARMVERETDDRFGTLLLSSAEFVELRSSSKSWAL